MHCKSKRAPLSLALLLALGCPALSLAQETEAEQDPEDIPEDADQMALPRVYVKGAESGRRYGVTGMKSGTPLIEMPQSVSVITSEQIRDQGVDNLAQALRYAPGVNGEPFGFAGLWERWTDPQDQSVLETCTILTTEANDYLRDIHPRMPVMLSPDAFDRWLDPQADVETAQDLLAPYPDDALTAYPISTRVNAVRNDDPSILEPLDTDETSGGSGSGGASGGTGDGGGESGERVGVGAPAADASSVICVTTAPPLLGPASPSAPGCAPGRGSAGASRASPLVTTAS